MDAPAILYMAGLLFSEALRLPRRVGRIRSREAWSGGNPLTRLLEMVVLASVLLGIWAFPIVYTFTDWLKSFDYSLPAWAVWLGAGIFLISLAVRWRTQRALGGLWSYTVELADKHALVTEGPYSRVRHPLYASLVLWAAAQPLLLSNVISGWSGAVAVALIWLIRVPREEKLMLERFGAEYEQYTARTGRLIPKCRQGRPAG
jgi:protein-S-isoprenylcysteine O-methyltransferase Ste14